MEFRFVLPDLRRIDELESEALLLPFFEDVRTLRRAVGLIDWRLCGQLSRMILRGRATGRLGQTVLIPARPRLPFDKLFLFGMGPRAGLDDAVVDAVVERMFVTLDRALIRTSVVCLPGRASELIAPEHAMRIFLGRAAQHPEQDRVSLIESPDAQRAMTPVIERERRRERAESLGD